METAWLLGFWGSHPFPFETRLFQLGLIINGQQLHCFPENWLFCLDNKEGSPLGHSLLVHLSHKVMFSGGFLGFCQIASLVIAFGEWTGLNSRDRILPADWYFKTAQIGSFDGGTTWSKNICQRESQKLIWRQSFQISFKGCRISFLSKRNSQTFPRHNLSPHQISGTNVFLRFTNEKRNCLGGKIFPEILLGDLLPSCLESKLWMKKLYRSQFFDLSYFLNFVWPSKARTK